MGESKGGENAKEFVFCGGLFSVNLTKLELLPPEFFFRCGSGKVRANPKRNLTEIGKVEV